MKWPEVILFICTHPFWSRYPRDRTLSEWLRDGADVNEWKTPQFALDVAALREGRSVALPPRRGGDTLGRKPGDTVQPTRYVLIEEPMGRARAEMAQSIDFAVVIDTPLEVALARRLLRCGANFCHRGDFSFRAFLTVES